MRNTRMRTRTLAATLALLVGGGVALAGCSSGSAPESAPTSAKSTEAAISGFQPLEKDTLTVAVWRMPSPGDFDGLDPADPGDGFGHQIVQQMAADFGLSNVKLVVRNFSAATSGNVKDFDIAYAPSPTEERKKVADFSDCFWSQASLIMTRKDRKLSSLADLKKLQWGVTLGSVQGSIITNEVKPDLEPRQFNGVVELFPALLTGTIDAAVGTVADVAPYVKNPQYADFDVHAQIIPSKDVAAVTCSSLMLPKGSPNVGLVNKSLHNMTDDGKIKKWYQKYQVPIVGLDPSKIPGIKISQ